MPTPQKKPVVIVTRKLPDVVETRMCELFDTRLNVDDKPMTQAQLVEAVRIADVLVPTVTDRIDRAVLTQAGPRLRLIANFGTGRRQRRSRYGAQPRHPGDQHAGRADRRYRRHDDGADPRRAAPSRRRCRIHARSGNEMVRLVADMDARAPDITASGSASSAWAASARP